ncbi:MAG: CDP-alcohol phosphatidyltransferase family protein [Ignavibacteriales bacterium]|nr:CDP-alcohol phosphatidyltransferase family protein [Ignavibacteriales bacterium]
MKILSSDLLKDAFNLPNSLSLFRLLLAIPFFFLLQNLDEGEYVRYILLSLIFVAFISDILDGYFARKKNIITEFGKVIDPLADKTLVILIVTQLYIQGYIVDIYFWTIVLRDLIILIGGIYITKKIDRVLPSNIVGKMTVLSIGIFIIIIILDGSPGNFIYSFLFYLSMILSVVSVVTYTFRGIEILRWKKNEVI